MIKLNNSTIVHVPKTAGMTIRAALLKYSLAHSVHGVPDDWSGNVFGFSRDPRTWYECWINFIKYGSSTVDPPRHDRLIVGIGIDRSADEIAEYLLYPTEKHLTRAYNGSMCWRNAIYERMISHKESLFSATCHVYLDKCRRVGKMENMRSDLVSMLESSGDMTDAMRESINSVEQQNVTEMNERLSPPMIDLISIRDAEIIEKYGYA